MIFKKQVRFILISHLSVRVTIETSRVGFMLHSVTKRRTAIVGTIVAIAPLMTA